MPYKLFKNGTQYCVRNEQTGENKGCSDTRADAVAHMRALYAIESGAKMGKKEIDGLVTKALSQFIEDNDNEGGMTTEEKGLDVKGYVPYGITSFEDLDSFRAAQDAAHELSCLTDDFSQLVQGVMMSPDITDKAAAVKSLADEFSTRLQAEANDAEDTSDVDPSDGEDMGDMGDMTSMEMSSKAVWSTASANNLPDSAFLYVEPGGSKDSEGKTVPRSKRHFPYKNSSGSIDLPHLRNAIARIPQSNIPGAKKKPLQARAQRMLANAKKELGYEQDVVERVFDKVKSLIGKEEDNSPMMIWKEDDGRYRWIARYSNNFRDDDNPAEIIAEKSHLRFVEMVDKGVFPPPQLWLWHVKEWKCGYATAVAYDDTGFAVATGYFDKGKEDVAEWLSKQKDVAVSHAMPTSSIVRDQADPTVIVEHQTVEISPLPLWAAANKLTGFVVLDATKEANMAIPEAKRKSFIQDWGINPDLLSKLEAQNSVDAEKGLSEKRERKEADQPVAEKDGGAQEATETHVEQEQVTPPADSPVAETSSLSEHPTRQEIADAFGTILGEFKTTLEGVAAQIVALDAEVKELKKADEDKVSKSVANVPAASLGALLAQRVIGREETAIDGRSSLAKSKPKEAAHASGSPIGIPFIDHMITGED